MSDRAKVGVSERARKLQAEADVSSFVLIEEAAGQERKAGADCRLTTADYRLSTDIGRHHPFTISMLKT